IPACGKRSSSSRCCAKRESAVFWRLDHWGNGRGFLRFFAVAYAGFQSRWSCKSFSELQADKQKGITCSHCRRHICVMTGICDPIRLAQNVLKPLEPYPCWLLGQSAQALRLRFCVLSNGRKPVNCGSNGRQVCLGLRIDGFNCARKAVQSTDDGNQNIVQPPIARHRRLSARIWPLLFAQSKAPTLPCIHRLESTTQEYTALFFTRPSSRIGSRSASKSTMGYIASSGRVCHCSTSASTSSVIVEIRSGQPSHPYSFNPCLRISRTLIPRAYRRITCASTPGKRRGYFAIRAGSKVESQARGISRGTSPTGGITVSALLPLR